MLKLHSLNNQVFYKHQVNDLKNVLTTLMLHLNMKLEFLKVMFAP